MSDQWKLDRQHGGKVRALHDGVVDRGLGARANGLGGKAEEVEIGHQVVHRVLRGDGDVRGEAREFRQHHFGAEA